MRCGWKGTLAEFLAVERNAWLAGMTQHFKRVTNEPPAESQRGAWVSSFGILKDQLAALAHDYPVAIEWGCIFEYELPREGGRRPDLVLLTDNTVIVVEFKEKSQPSQADVDQVMAYARDLAAYHKRSHECAVIAVLVPAGAAKGQRPVGEVHVVAPPQLAAFLAERANGSAAAELTLDEWIQSPYEPLPFLVEAARYIFRHERLPIIDLAHARAQIPSVIEYLVHVAELAQLKRERHLALITGIPGAGKTLIGLQFVYEHSFGSGGSGAANALFLSGNGPLVTVLQHALRSRVFVQPMRNFIIEYQMPGTTPEEHVLVFDEAQRAWSSDHFSRKHGINASEPDVLIQIAERLSEWALVVGLMGEGQEIHTGEEAGISQWNAALAKGGCGWHVHSPVALASAFPAAAGVEIQPLLALNTSLRTHVAHHVQDWVRVVLEGDVDGATSLAESIRSRGFTMYITRSLADAKAYARERYEGQPLKRYGLLASSRPDPSFLDDLGVRRDYETRRRLKIGPWFNDEPTSSLSCCQLETVASEFECQGLELDFPIVCWSDDLWWEEDRWQSHTARRAQARNPHQLRVNSYRVLLSRGRDGFAVWVPEVRRLDEVYTLLTRAGLMVLPARTYAISSQ